MSEIADLLAATRIIAHRGKEFLGVGDPLLVSGNRIAFPSRRDLADCLLDYRVNFRLRKRSLLLSYHAVYFPLDKHQNPNGSCDSAHSRNPLFP